MTSVTEHTGDDLGVLASDGTGEEVRAEPNLGARAGAHLTPETAETGPSTMPHFAFPRGWTETRYVVYAYRRMSGCWQRAIDYGDVLSAQNHADAINSREGCHAVVGVETIRHDDVQPVRTPSGKDSSS